MHWDLVLEGAGWIYSPFRHYINRYEGCTPVCTCTYPWARVYCCSRTVGYVWLIMALIRIQIFPKDVKITVDFLIYTQFLLELWNVLGFRMHFPQCCCMCSWIYRRNIIIKSPNSEAREYLIACLVNIFPTSYFL